MVGRAEAKHVLVEVVDYTCPRCRLLHEQVKAARAVLGDDFAVMVVTLPLDRACNDAVAETEERHRDACRLARIAHAVFAIDPTKFAAMHDWLFANQGADAAAAMAQAQQMVDPARLAGWLTDPRLDTIIQRDIDLAKRLGVRQLPGLLSGDHTFDDIPDDPVVLADLIRRITGASVPGERLGR
jgi:protein-disulfide isomerase